MRRALLVLLVSSACLAAPPQPVIELPPVPAGDCGLSVLGPRPFLPPPDCSFRITESSIGRELALRRGALFDPRASTARPPRLFGLPEPPLFSALALAIVALGALRRAAARRPRPAAALPKPPKPKPDCLARAS